MEKVYILDTNIILNDAKSIYQFSDGGKNLIVIPEVVLDEIDSKKTGNDEINYNAREFGRMLENYVYNVSTETIGKHKCVKYSLKNGHHIELVVISKEQYDADSQNLAHNILNDRKILEIAEFCANHYSVETVFLSLDVMCRNRAISMGIKTETIKGTQEDFVFENIKYINSTHSKSSLNNLDIYTLDPQHKPENCSYVVTLEDTGEKVIGYVEKDCFVCIDEDMLQKQEVSPRNIEQKLFSSAILNPYFSIVVADSPAGSGKTLIALSSAMKLVDSKTTNYNKIVYIRNSIESIDKGEDVGYLAGNDEKFKIYNYPLYDSLSFIAHKQLDRSNSNKTKANRTIITQEAIEEKTNELLKRYAIETMWVGEMRGRTISNAVVIVDEAQNMSAKTGSLVFSRLDEGCKLIVIGSNKQIDNPYINKYINTLSTLLLASKQNHPELNIFACELKKVLRGKITEFSERIFGSVKSK